MTLTTKVFVAGHRGLVGSAVLRRMRQLGYENIVTRERSELDLCDQLAVERFFSKERPEAVVLAAAKVGGIHANRTYPAEFIYENLIVECNVIHAAHRHGVMRFVYLGSSCIYPRSAPQPMKEEYLLTGPLEPTNEPYAIAKIAGFKMCEAYGNQYGMNTISLQPTNMYGPGDNFGLQDSHVLPALLRKYHEAKVQNSEEVVLWGTGEARREFLFVEDFAEACETLMRRYDVQGLINVGTGEDITIRELAVMIADVVGYTGKTVFDTSMPDGMPRKLLDVSKLRALGYSARTSLREGIQRTYAWYQAQPKVRQEHA